MSLRMKLMKSCTILVSCFIIDCVLFFCVLIFYAAATRAQCGQSVLAVHHADGSWTHCLPTMEAADGQERAIKK